MIRKWMSIAICLSLLSSTNHAAALAAFPQSAAVENPQSMEALLQKPYLELLEMAPTLQYTRPQFEQERKRLEQREENEKEKLERRKKGIEGQIKQAQEELKTLSKQKETEQVAARRHDLHCRIQALESELTDVKVALQNGVPVQYENLKAKLELLEKWPTEQRKIKAQLESGQARQRRWGDVEDIGFRVIEENQADDIRKGQEAVREMRQMGMMPKRIEDEVVTEYINRVSLNIARNSDLKVPLNVTVLNSKEINAFALPGGFLFVNSGLIQEARNETQLAGVMAHEMAHVVARHGHRLMRRATISSIIYQAAQIGALIFTGGVAGIGTYYALQYGFYGLGLALSLQLLGVSRDYELEADQLGVQYAWNAGYNPEGFIQFFDIMASKEGYVEKTSFFRTHPAFYERIVDAYREISFLPAKERLVENTREFGAVKERLATIAAEMEKREEDAPTLYPREEGCPELETPAAVQ